jgi:hypothetical protein
MPEAIEDLRCQRKARDFEIWEDNWEIVAMFMRMQTQWIVGFSGATGLNYPSLEYLCRLYSVKDPVTVFEGVQVMEAAALTIMNEQKS